MSIVFMQVFVEHMLFCVDMFVYCHGTTLDLL